MGMHPTLPAQTVPVASHTGRSYTWHQWCAVIAPVFTGNTGLPKSSL